MNKEIENLKAVLKVQTEANAELANRNVNLLERIEELKVQLKIARARLIELGDTAWLRTDPSPKLICKAHRGNP